MFLELHDSSGALHINMDNVICFRRYDRNETTQVVMLVSSGDGLATFHVRETPLQIDSMILTELASIAKPAR